MILTEQDLAMLTQVYNALTTIETKGTQSFTMVDCMMALQAFIQKKQQESKEVQNNGETVSA